MPEKKASSASASLFWRVLGKSPQRSARCNAFLPDVWPSKIDDPCTKKIPPGKRSRFYFSSRGDRLSAPYGSWVFAACALPYRGHPVKIWKVSDARPMVQSLWSAACVYIPTMMMRSSAVILNRNRCNNVLTLLKALPTS